MTRVPRLTIGLPVYNGERFLTESIEALLGQTFDDFELVISDNASTDDTASICQRYAKQDSRIRYIRQPRNIGLTPNENFLMRAATGEFFKLAAHDDLYARDMLKRCIEVLDVHPEVVVADCWEAWISADGVVTKGLTYSLTAVRSLSAPERFRTLLFDGWEDYTYGVIRTSVLQRTHLFGSYHMSDRTQNIELALHGPMYLIPDWMYFRREYPERETTPYTVRSRCAYMDPRRANRLRHPVTRLYAEYLWSYLAAIHNAPLSAAERRECYQLYARWLARRAMPVVSRTLRRAALPVETPMLTRTPDIPVDRLVAGRERKLP